MLFSPVDLTDRWAIGLTIAHGCGIAFQKQTQFIICKGKLRSAAIYAHKDCGEDKDGGLINILKSGKVDGYLRHVPAQLLRTACSAKHL